MEIKPTYVTFKQAKLLPNDFENVAFACYYKGEFYAHKNLLNVSGVKENLHPIDKNEVVLAPEQWQVVEWLDKKYNQYIHIQKHTRNGLKCYSPFINNKTVKKDVFFNDFDTPQEAYSAAFDYILNNLL